VLTWDPSVTDGMSTFGCYIDITISSNFTSLVLLENVLHVVIV
jgi:hypothetical protein